MRADQIQARAVAKIVLVALFWGGVAVLLAIALLHTRTTLQWVAAAIFLPWHSTRPSASSSAPGPRRKMPRSSRSC